MNESEIAEPLARVDHLLAQVRCSNSFIAAMDVELFRDQVGQQEFEIDRAGDEADLLDYITECERAKAAISAAQARAAHRVWTLQRERDAKRGIKSAVTTRSVASQVALARRESPSRGSRHLGFARAMVEEMPATLRELSVGELSEWQATLLVRETGYLTREDRTCIDGTLAPTAGQLSDRRLCAAVTACANQLDPQAVIKRRAYAESRRRVSVRPAPMTMTMLSALLPVKGGVACQIALAQAADQARAAGDRRSRGQVMADTLVERITGQTVADIPVKLVLVEQTAAASSKQTGRAAHLAGYGAISGDLADELRASAGATSTIAPSVTANVTANATNSAPAQPHTRAFPESVRHVVQALDGQCRTPWCDAEIRHIDHVTRHADGGASTLDNAQGLCEHCNYAKEHPDWRAQATGPPSGFEQTVTTTTASGKIYQTRRE